MKIRLKFCVLLCLTVFLTTFAAESKKFCFKEITGGTPVLEFFQKTGAAESGESCFDSWYSDGVGDAVTYLNAWLASNSNGIVSVTSNIEFAGRIGDACNDGATAFKGKTIDMSGSQFWQSGTGGPYTRSGACYVGVSDVDRIIGFATFAGGSSGGIRNLKFSEAYFKTSASSAYVGIIPELQSCPTATVAFEVENSEFYGDYAGAVVGYFADHTEPVSGAIVKNVTVTGKNAGGAFGYAMNIKGLENIKVNSVTVSGIDENDWLDCFLGGVSGRLQMAWESGISNVKVDGVNAHCEASTGVSYIGGIAGYFTHDNGSSPYVGDTVVNATLSGGDYMGGLWGVSIYSGNGATSLTIEDALFQGLITGNCGSKAGGIVGEMQEGSSATDNVTIIHSSVVGDISAGCSDGVVDTTQVGGLVGNFRVIDGRAPENSALSIENTYSIGDISGTGNVGYLVGKLDENLGDNNLTSIKNNYHYGTQDASTSLGIGSYTLSDWQNPASANVYKNVRNGVRGLDVDGTLITDSDNKIISTNAGGQLANGVADSEDMKSGALAQAFNDGSGVWNRTDNVNDGLPYFEGFAPTSSNSGSSNSDKPVESSGSTSPTGSSNSDKPVESSGSTAPAGSSNSENPEGSSGSTAPTESSNSDKPVESSGSESKDSSGSGDLPVESSAGGADHHEGDSTEQQPDYTIPLEIVRAEMEQTGRALQVAFKGSDFDARRKVTARIEIKNLRSGKPVVDSLLGDSVASAIEKTLVFRMKEMGEFSVNVSLKDSKEDAVYSDTLTVEKTLGGEPNTWYMVSLASVDKSSFHWNDDQHLYWWDDGDTGDFWRYKKLEKGDSLVGNRGFWYSSLKGEPLVLKAGNDEKKAVEWLLDSSYTGWNMISNPYGWRIDLFSENPGMVEGDFGSETVFWRYNPKTYDYEETRYLEPYEAAWVKVSKMMTWKASTTPVFLEAQEDDENQSFVENEKSLAKAESRNGWCLQLVLSDRNGRRDAGNTLGVASHPFVVDEPPASMGERVNLSIVEDGRLLAKSVRSAGNAQEWTLRLDASDERAGYISVNGAEKLSALGKHVYVTVDGATTELKAGDSLQVSLGKSAKNATVRVTDEAKAYAKASLGVLHTVRSGNRLQVSFNASGNLEGKMACVDILDLKGRVLATRSVLVHGGTANLSMDVPGSGLYVVRARAQGIHRSELFSVK